VGDRARNKLTVLSRAAIGRRGAEQELHDPAAVRDRERHRREAGQRQVAHRLQVHRMYELAER